VVGTTTTTTTTTAATNAGNGRGTPAHGTPSHPSGPGRGR
jgi:hypothetical protein